MHEWQGCTLSAVALHEVLGRFLGCLERKDCPIDLFAIVRTQFECVRGHGGDGASESDQRGGPANRNVLARLVDCRVDVACRSLDLPRSGRVGLEVAFSHAHATNIHGVSGNGRFCAQHEFCRTTTKINHEVGAGVLRAEHAHRAREAQLGFFFPGYDLGFDTDRCLDARHEYVAVLRVPRGRRGNKANPFNTVGGADLGVPARRSKRPLESVFSKTPSLVYSLPEAHDLHKPHVIRHRPSGTINISHKQADGIRSAVNCGYAHATSGKLRLGFGEDHINTHVYKHSIRI